MNDRLNQCKKICICYRMFTRPIHRWNDTVVSQQRIFLVYNPDNLFRDGVFLSGQVFLLCHVLYSYNWILLDNKASEPEVFFWRKKIFQSRVMELTILCLYQTCPAQICILHFYIKKDIVFR